MTSTDNTLVNLQEEYENRQIQQVLDELEQA
jgi:predicted HAD superfamily phosphohydrolase YqeG